MEIEPFLSHRCRAQDVLPAWLIDRQTQGFAARPTNRLLARFALLSTKEGRDRLNGYPCRPAGKPAFYVAKYPGTYNARRDNLEGFWQALFGYSHGIMVATAFFENVKRHRYERRDLQPGEKEENIVLEFKPQPAGDMLVACLWSRWQGKDEPDLLSFAAITDDPPPEISEVGHDRCVIPIRPENTDAWLRPDATNLAQQYAILDDRERPYYKHLLAA
ncbi:hypothetical protein DIE20_11320 [Burkholderia sp. Bp9131]|nr:hypothetical protein DIE20_11320 [Burkholderia sp. Bp9131]